VESFEIYIYILKTTIIDEATIQNSHQYVVGHQIFPKWVLGTVKSLGNSDLANRYLLENCLFQLGT